MQYVTLAQLNESPIAAETVAGHESHHFSATAVTKHSRPSQHITPRGVPVIKVRTICVIPTDGSSVQSHCQQRPESLRES